MSPYDQAAEEVWNRLRQLPPGDAGNALALVTATWVNGVGAGGQISRGEAWEIYQTAVLDALKFAAPGASPAPEAGHD
jgi:hypothetical protein